MKIGGLFSGIGGFELGLARCGMEIAYMVERDEFCRRVLAKNAPTYWPNAKIFEDIKDVGRHNLPATDLICGGVPCQPFSQAGKRRGQDDDRYLWPEMLRVITELAPRWVLGENVAGFIDMALDQAISDLESAGYTVEPVVLPACAVDASHRRDRVWIVAYARSDFGSLRLQFGDGQEEVSQDTSAQIRRENWLLSEMGTVPTLGIREWEREFSEPKLVRIPNGLSSELDRIKSLGNAVVPQLVEVLGRFILEMEKMRTL